MKYPQTLTSKLKEIKDIVESWPVTAEYEEVVKWMMQFDNNDFELAFRIIKNLNVIGYEELKSALNIAYSKLERKSIDKNTKINSKNTLFAGIGEGGKSGAMISYNFRLINELSEENFLDENSLIHIEKGRIENIVLVDDIISTGNQAKTEIQKLTESVVPLGVKNIFLLTAVGMKEGIKKVEEETGAYVFSAFEYDVNDTISSLDSPFYDGLEFENRKALRDRLEYYGKICSPKSPIGYGGIGSLIVFYYNTPNSTIPHVWSTLNSWLPLFKRTIRINGIDSYYKQIENLHSQKPKPEKGKGEFNFFVEGRTEETFFDSLLDQLKDITGTDKVNVIALGGFFSKKLIENLNKSETRYLFVIEEDPYRPHPFKTRLDELFKEKPHVKILPILDYFNIESIMNDEELPKSITSLKIKEDSMNNLDVRKDLEILLFKRFVDSMRETNMKKLISKHIDPKKLEKLLADIKSKINNEG